MALAPPARAHHPASEQFPGHAGLGDRLLLEGGVARYDHGGVEADVQTLLLDAEKRLDRRWSLGARLPLARADAAGAGTETGLGDLELTAKAALQNWAGASWTGGLAVSLPTGDDAKGLGSGHLELAPFAAFDRHASGLHWHGAGALLWSAKDSGHGHGPDVVSPHSERELRAHLGAAYAAGAGAYLNMVAALGLPIQGEDAGKLFLELRPEVGIPLPGAWTLGLLVQVPVLEERWFDFQTRVQLRRSF